MLNEILRSVANDISLMEALKAALKAEFDKPIDTNKNDAELGQIVRARTEGMKNIDEVFRKIAQMKTPEKKLTGENPAR